MSVPIQGADFVDPEKLDIRDGAIHYALYQQDGTMQPMTCPDTFHNRQCVAWIKIHDRYTPGTA